MHFQGHILSRTWADKGVGTRKEGRNSSNNTAFAIKNMHKITILTTSANWNVLCEIGTHVHLALLTAKA
jgi:hypothetical protein